MPIIRKTDPTDVQSVWDAIAHINWQKAVPEPEKILKELVKSHGFSLAEWKKCLEDLFSDNLIEKAWRRSALKTQVLSFPTSERLVSDARDWYCFECHKAGDVKFCETSSCHRVFHAECVPKDYKNIYFLFFKLITNSGSTIFLKKGKLDVLKSLSMYLNEWDEQKQTYNYNACTVCNMRRVDSFSTEKSEFNSLLKFVHTRSKAWVPTNIVHKMNGADPYPDWISENDLLCRAKYLFCRPTDMAQIEVKIENQEYLKFSDYLSDILTVKHNIGIFHGYESQEYEAAKFVSRDVFHDIGEIVSCIDCFKHSSEMLSTDWFALPCRNPHEIVWAKQKGYCYWPAKVIKKFEATYDVRFFGAKHERAIVNQDCIKPVTTPRRMLQLKLSSSLDKAISEMELLLKFMKNPSELEAYMSTNTKPSKKIGLPKKLNPNESDKPLKKRKTIVKTTSLATKSSSNIEVLVKEERVVEKVTNDDKKLVAEETPKSSALPSKTELSSDPGTAGNDISIRRRNESDNSDEKSPSDDPSSAENEIPAKRRKKSDSSDKSEIAVVKKNLLEGITLIINEEPIRISDDEDNVYTFSGSLTKSAMEFNDSIEEPEVEQVTSSTEGEDVEDAKNTQNLPQLNHSQDDAVENMRSTLQRMSSKAEIIRAATSSMQTEINRLTEKHNEQLKKLCESHKKEILETKKKQWCYFCGQDAIYHCCWNTAYCSVQCQKQHWQQEHKKVCRRKR